MPLEAFIFNLKDPSGLIFLKNLHQLVHKTTTQFPTSESLYVCMVYSGLYSIHTKHNTLSSTHYTLHITQCTEYITQCRLSTVASPTSHPRGSGRDPLPMLGEQGADTLSLYSTVLHCTTLHCITLRCTVDHLWVCVACMGGSCSTINRQDRTGQDRTGQNFKQSFI